jgi:FAD/FMN-containing dehydrogenase
MQVNDVHSKLNAVDVAEVVAVDSLDAIRAALADSDLPVAIAGGRHAMGGQQFCAAGLLLDTRPLDRVLEFDDERGVIEVEAGMQWPELLAYLRDQVGDGPVWGIRQKQTGADRLSLGGALAANVHGRGLTLPPIVADVESFTLVGADGGTRVCSRDENADFFALAIGGYGLFGVIYSVRLRLAPRRKLERVVEIRSIEDLTDAFEQRIADGFLFGDFQFSIDPNDPEFLRRGVFSCYRRSPTRRPCRRGSARCRARTGSVCFTLPTRTRRRPGTRTRSTTWRPQDRSTGRMLTSSVTTSTTTTWSSTGSRARPPRPR